MDGAGEEQKSEGLRKELHLCTIGRCELQSGITNHRDPPQWADHMKCCTRLREYESASAFSSGFFSSVEAPQNRSVGVKLGCQAAYRESVRSVSLVSEPGGVRPQDPGR